MTLVNLVGFQRGVELDETALNIETFDVTTRPEYKEFLKDKVGEKRGFAVAQPEQEITVVGEISGGTGLMAGTFAAAQTLANDVDYFGMVDGAIFMDEATVSQGREAWKNLNWKGSRNGNIDGLS